jgi:hypothetical protein
MASVKHIHAVELFKRTKQFKGWKAEDVNALAISLDGVIARHLQVGFSVIVRDDDYKTLYETGPHPRRLAKDTKYGVCFRACLAFVPSYIASEFTLAQQSALAQQTTINFVLEQGHRNARDAQRLFKLYKADVLPERQRFVGTMVSQRKLVPAPKLRIFLHTASITQRASNTGMRPQLSRSHHTSPTRR